MRILFREEHLWSLILKVNQLFLKCQHLVSDWLEGEEVETSQQIPSFEGQHK